MQESHDPILYHCCWCCCTAAPGLNALLPGPQLERSFQIVNSVI